MNINKATKDFINQHRTEDVRQLALRYGGGRQKDVDGIDIAFALDQIAGWQTAKRKLPTWAATDGIIFPPHLNMEQCSSEKTARYKESLALALFKAKGMGEKAGERLIDLTGGFGVDFSFLSQCFAHAVYVERNEKLCDIARHNFNVLGLDNAEVVCSDASAFLTSHKPQTSSLKSQTLIYLDPARRDTYGRKVFGIEDCTPDVLTMKDQLLDIADTVMIKLSPMLDWHAAVKAFGGNCHEVHIVSVDNECKELLLVLGGNKTDSVKLNCVNDGLSLVVYYPFQDSAVDYLEHDLFNDVFNGKYLFVPDASIMKAGCFAEVSKAFGVKMMDKNSHLFVGDKMIEGFPGRVFIINSVSTMNKRELKEKLRGVTKANISVRNFPLSVDALRKRLKLKDGGDVYLFATTVNGQHIIFFTSKA